MSFSRDVRTVRHLGLDAACVDVPLVVTGSRGDILRTFRFDTGSVITTVSEDVAAQLGLPTGGTPVRVRARPVRPAAV